jgi:hypothetical protein
MNFYILKLILQFDNYYFLKKFTRKYIKIIFFYFKKIIFYIKTIKNIKINFK